MLFCLFNNSFKINGYPEISSYSQPSLQRYDAKLNFCCNDELKFKQNWNISANTIDVVKNFAVIMSVSIKSFH